MRIAMFTNFDQPPCGGITRSITLLTSAFNALSHEVRVFAPDGEFTSASGIDIVPIPSVKRVLQTPFSAPLPTPWLTETVEEFLPEIIHVHNPFLLGATAMRIAVKLGIPIVYTHHTQYEKYLHHFGVRGEFAAHAIRELAEGYANLCDAIIAPSESIAEILRSRLEGTRRVDVIPTGVDTAVLHTKNQAIARRRFGLSKTAPVAGTVSRLEPEKNLPFLCRAACIFLARVPDALFLIAGGGSQEELLRSMFAKHGFSHRVLFVGELRDEDLLDAYNAMDVFGFASTSETQGVVLAEAMACGVPVVALNASGAKDIVTNGWNGRLIFDEDADAFALALEREALCQECTSLHLRENALSTARKFDHVSCARDVIGVYERLETRMARSTAGLERWEAEYLLWQNMLKACIAAASVFLQHTSARQNAFHTRGGLVR